MRRTPPKYVNRIAAVDTGTSPAWWGEPSRHWLETVRSRVKQADLGGSPDTPFEQAFANLAHSYIRDKAPKLMDYEIGFQLVEKGDDNTKALGIFGFKAGDQWLYAPVMFLNGDLKGHELLYIKSQDLFVPLKDNWLNELLGRKSSLMGKLVSRNPADLGVSRPSFRELRPNLYKTGGLRLPTWLDGFIPTLAQCFTTSVGAMTKYAGMPKFADVVREFGPAGVRFCEEIQRQFPPVARAYDSFHGAGEFSKIAASVNCLGNASILKTAANEPPAVPRAGGVRIVFRREIISGNFPTDLSTDEKTEAFREGHTIRDRRKPEEVAKIFIDNAQPTLANPTETGIYAVLLKDGTFGKRLVLIGSHVVAGRSSRAHVIDSEKKTISSVDPRSVFCREAYDRTEYERFLESLPSVDSLSDSSDDMNVVALGNNISVGPFCVNREYSGNSGKSFSVSWRDDPRDCCAKRLYGFPKSSVDKITLASSQKRQPAVIGTEMLLPGSFKILKLPYSCYDSDTVGTMQSLSNALHSETHPLTVSCDGHTYTVNGKSHTKEAALRTLLLDWNLSVPDVKNVCKLTDESPRTSHKFLVKVAAQAAVGSRTYAPPFPDAVRVNEPLLGSYATAELPHQEFRPVDSMRANPANAERYRPENSRPPDGQTLRIAMNAAKTGDRDAFDTGMIAALIKSVRQDSLVDRYLPDLLKATDRVGRIYLQFLWHNEEFEERYGKHDMPILEDSLRDTFERVGDLTLMLKRKGAGSLLHDGSDIDMGSMVA